MKKIYFAFLTITFALFAGEKIQIVTGEYFPYSTEKGINKGILVEVINEIEKRTGLDFEIKFYPWKRCEELVKKGEAFGAFPYIVTEERNKIFYFSEPLIKSIGKFFYLKDKIKSPSWSSYDNLMNYTIGGTLGYWYEIPFRENNLKVDYSPDDDTSLKKLYTGRVNILAIEELVGWALIKKYYPTEIEKFETMEKNLNESDLHLMISKVYPMSKTLRDKFNSGLKEIKADGTFDKIVNKYKK